MADLTVVNPLFLALFAPGGAEISGNGYARIQITNDATVFSVDGSGNRTSIVPISSVTATGTGWGIVEAVGFFDVSTGGTVLASKDIPRVSVGAAQSISFPAGALGYSSGSSGAITVAVPGLVNIARSLYLYENRGIQALSLSARSLYLYENRGIQALSLSARSLYLYENRGIQALSVQSRSLYLYENRGIQALSILARSLYLYEATRDAEVSPWLMDIRPNEQVVGGQINLYGDGFGDLVEVAGEATITVSSTSGSNVAANVVDRSASEWVSNEGSSAWIRLTWNTARSIVGIGLEGRGDANNRWGVPLFQFSSGPDVVGSGEVPVPVSTAEYPVGMNRAFYPIDPARTAEWVEIRVASGGAGSARGLREVWVYESRGAAAETSRAVLNRGKPTEVTLGVVSWTNRSPGLWPANLGAAIDPAAVVTIPNGAVSGMVVVEETT